MSAHSISPAATVLGVPICGVSLRAVLDIAFARIRARESTLFTTANAHSIVVAQGSRGLAAHFRSADVVLPDGIAAVLAARVEGGAIAERVPGPDFFAAFLERAAQEHVSVFFLGVTEEKLKILIRRCRERWPTLSIKGALAPPFQEFDESVNRQIIAEIDRSGADALFVAMTAPKQELWLSRHAWKLNVPFAMGVGAAFDFLAGTKQRAPAFFRRAGLEWLFRLASEPRRMWRRNLDNLVFLWLLARGHFVRAAPLEARTNSRRRGEFAVALRGAPAWTVDVSEGGLCVELAERASRGETITGRIQVEGRRVPFSGRIAWVEPPRGATRRRRVGVQFTRTPPELRNIFMAGTSAPQPA